MRLLTIPLLLALAAPAPEIRHFRYERALQGTSATSGQNCVVLDPALFADAAPDLADLRLYRDAQETPYVIRTATPLATSPQQIGVLNLGRRNGQTAFDAQMPERAYSDITLAMEAHDFLATVSVSGSQSQDATNLTRIGDFTIFDLTKQRLGRSTVLHLPRSDFRFLHFRIDGPVAPERVTGLTVERAAAPTLPAYQVVASSSRTVQKPHVTEVELAVPAHTPVDRVVIVPGDRPANFSREVAVTVTPTAARAKPDTEPPPPTVFTGSLLRLHRAQEGRRIDEEQLTIAVPARESEEATRWSIAVQNGDDEPVSIVSARLEMVERSLCFDSTGTGAYSLYYGDAALSEPRYDYAALFVEQAGATRVSLGREISNPGYEPRADERPFTERHPELLWTALGVAIVALGVVAIRSIKEPKAPA